MGTLDPRIETRPEQHYVGMRRRVARRDVGRELGPRLGELAAWLEARGQTPAGPPFFRYWVVDTADRLEVEAALPVSQPLAEGQGVSPGVLPAGRYLVARHVGHYDGLQAATASLKSWAASRGIRLSASPDETEWTSRIEIYLTDPAAEPDPERWITDLAILVQGEM